MRMGKQAKFSPCERKFVCQHEMARDCEPFMQLVHHILQGGHGEDKLQNFIINLHLIFWKVCSAILCRPQGEKFPFLLLLRMKGRIETMQNLNNIIQQ